MGLVGSAERPTRFVLIGKTLAQELKVISDSYDLILYLSQRISKFPRQHRYSLGLSMEQRLQVFLALLIRAKYTSACVSVSPWTEKTPPDFFKIRFPGLFPLPSRIQKKADFIFLKHRPTWAVG